MAENTSADERNATLIITSGASQTRVMVVQKQKDALTLSSARYEVDANGGDLVVEGQHNIPCGYVIDTEAAGWIKPIENTKAMSTSTLGFTVSENEGVNKREGTVRIVSGDISEIVTVYQDGSEPSLVLTQTEYAVGSDGGVVVIEVRSNTEYSMTMPAGEGRAATSRMFKAISVRRALESFSRSYFGFSGSIRSRSLRLASSSSGMQCSVSSANASRMRFTSSEFIIASFREAA